MTIDTTRRDDNLPMRDAKCAVSGRIGSRGAGSRVASAAIWLGCAVVSAIPMATTASAHVKWFVICNASEDRKSTRLNSSHQIISYAVFCLKKKKQGNGSPVMRTACSLVFYDIRPRARNG